MYYKKAKNISYAPKKRTHDDILFIVIHYTGNKKDTAKNNIKYFASTNTRKAGAHFFVDHNERGKSIPMNRTAYSVGGCYDENAPYYLKCTNFNSVSIELCDAVGGFTQGHIIQIKKVLKYIKKYCKNTSKQRIIFHNDVNGKLCPDWTKSVKKEFLDEIKSTF